MSFTTTIKNEITGLSVTQTEKIALLTGFIRNNATYQDSRLILTSENRHIVVFLQELLNTIKEISYELTTTENNNFSKNELYLLIITKQVDFLISLVCFKKEVPDLYLVDGNEEMRSYLRGVFLSTGSINDPKTSQYHMELLINRPEEAIFVQKILNKFELNAKLLNRDKGYMIYIKEAEKISDFLKLLGTTKAVLYFENVRAYHEHKNKTNRLNNCEQANIDRVIETAMQQTKYIQLIKDHLAMELLDDKTKEALTYRLKYPEASLKELSEIISIETGKRITKSGLNHRFRKMKDLALKLQSNQTK